MARPRDRAVRKHAMIAVVRAAHARGCSLYTFTHTYRVSFLNTAVTGCDLT